MPNTTLICDRCGKPIDGFESDISAGGFYYVTPNSPWHKYQRDDERRVCDNCMWSSVDYIAIYGDNR